MWILLMKHETVSGSGISWADYYCWAVLGKIIFEMISNQNQNHESLIDLKS